MSKRKQPFSLQKYTASITNLSKSWTNFSDLEKQKRISELISKKKRTRERIEKANATKRLIKSSSLENLAKLSRKYNDDIKLNKASRRKAFIFSLAYYKRKKDTALENGNVPLADAYEDVILNLKVNYNAGKNLSISKRDPSFIYLSSSEYDDLYGDRANWQPLAQGSIYGYIDVENKIIISPIDK